MSEAVAAALRGLLDPLVVRLRGPAIAGLAARLAEAGADAGLAGLVLAAPRAVAGLREAHAAVVRREEVAVAEVHAATSAASRREALLRVLRREVRDARRLRADVAALRRDLDLEALRERFADEREAIEVAVELAVRAVGRALASLANEGSAGPDWAAAAGPLRRAGLAEFLLAQARWLPRFTLRLAAIEGLQRLCEGLGAADPEGAIARAMQERAADGAEHPWVRAAAISVWTCVAPGEAPRVLAAALYGQNLAAGTGTERTDEEADLGDELPVEEGPRGFVLRRLVVDALARRVDAWWAVDLLVGATLAGEASEHVRVGLARAAIAVAAAAPVRAAGMIAALADPRRERCPQVRAWALLAATATGEAATLVRALAEEVEATPLLIACRGAARVAGDGSTAGAAALVAGLGRLAADPERGAAVHEAAAAALEQVDAATDPLRAGWTTVLAEALARVRPGAATTVALRRAELARPSEALLGRILAALTREDWGVDADVRGDRLVLRRGDVWRTRLWRVLHELRRPAPGKRAAHPHGRGRVLGGTLRAPSGLLHEVTATGVPGERVHVDREGGWGRHLPRVDDLLGLPLLRPRPVQVVSSFGVCTLAWEVGLAGRIAARLRLALRYAWLAEMRVASLAAEEEALRGRYVAAVRGLGISVTFAGHPRPTVRAREEVRAARADEVDGATARGDGATAQGDGATGRSDGATGRSDGATGRSDGATERSDGATERRRAAWAEAAAGEATAERRAADEELATAVRGAADEARTPVRWATDAGSVMEARTGADEAAPSMAAGSVLAALEAELAAGSGGGDVEIDVAGGSGAWSGGAEEDEARRADLLGMSAAAGVVVRGADAASGLAEETGDADAGGGSRGGAETADETDPAGVLRMASGADADGGRRGDAETADAASVLSEGAGAGEVAEGAGAGEVAEGAGGVSEGAGAGGVSEGAGAAGGLPAELRALFGGAAVRAAPLGTGAGLAAAVVVAPGVFEWLAAHGHYFLSVSANSQQALAYFLLALALVVLVGAFVRRRQVARARAAIPLVIGGWGTRGKSGTERLKLGLLHGLGYRVFAKTTGCEAMFLHAAPQGPPLEIFTFRPYGKATIWEQRTLLRLAAELRSEVFLWECMALTPAYVEILQRHWMRDDLATITNAYPDHEDIQGPAGMDVAEVIARFVPDRSRVVTSEINFLPVLQAAAAERRSELVAVGDLAGDLIAPDLLKLLPYDEHPRNVALVARLAEELGVDPTLAIVTFAEHVVPDLGVLQRFGPARVRGRAVEFINGCSANERTGFLSNWRRTGCDRMDLASAPDRYVITAVNNREDRVARSQVFARVLVEDVAVDRHLILGTNTRGLVGYVRAALADFLAAQAIVTADDLAAETGRAAARTRLTRLLARLRIPPRTPAALAEQLEVYARGADRTLGAEALAEAEARVAPWLAEDAGRGVGLAAVQAEVHASLGGWARALVEAAAPRVDEAPEVDAAATATEVATWWTRQVARAAIAGRLHARLGACMAAGPGAIDGFMAGLRAAYTELFLELLDVIEDPLSTGDQVVVRCAMAVPPGVRVTVMGTQNIKGTGLDFVYRWLALAAAQRDLQALASRDPRARAAAWQRLASPDDPGLIDAGLVAGRLAAMQPRSGEEELHARARTAAQTRHAGRRAGLKGQARGGRGAALAGWIEAWIDFVDAALRQRRAGQVMRDLAARRISHARAALVMRELDARAKGGWLARRWRARRDRRSEAAG